MGSSAIAWFLLALVALIKKGICMSACKYFIIFLISFTLLACSSSSNETTDSVPACEASEGCTKISFTVLDEGTGNLQSTIQAGGYTFTDTIEFSDFYNDFVCSTASSCIVPTVDFSTDMTIAVIKGGSSVTCVAIEIDDIQSFSEKITIYVSRYGPDGDTCAQSESNPYQIVTMPLTTEDISFDYTDKDIDERED